MDIGKTNGNGVSFKIDERILIPNVTAGITVESLVERALVHLYSGQDFEHSLSFLSSEEMARKMFDQVFDEVLCQVPEMNGKSTEQDYDQATVDYEITKIITQFDGAHPSNLIYNRLIALLSKFPYCETIESITRRSEEFIKKLHEILVFILKKKRENIHRTGVAQFLYEFGHDDELKDLEGGNLDPERMISLVLERNSANFELVPSGEGGRFKCHRIRIKLPKEDGTEETEWYYTSMVIKAMKELAGSSNGQLGIFTNFRKEHDLVRGHFGDEYVPETHFRNTRNGGERMIAEHDGLNKYLVFQEYVAGQSILSACQDPFLAEHLARILPQYIELYEAMEDTHKRVIDCSSIAKRNVLVRRRLNSRDEDELRVWIVDTNNLITVDSAKYKKLFVDRHTGEQHYLRRLRAIVANGGQLVD